MDDLKALMIGVFGGLIVLGLSKAFRAYRKKSLIEDIEFTEFEKNHLAEMKRSSVEMNRSSFRAIFVVLIFIALANLLPSVLELSGAAEVGNFIAIFLWFMVLVFTITFYKRYDSLKKFKEATARLDVKLDKLRAKYDES